MPFASPLAAFRVGSLLCAFSALLLVGAAPKPALKPVVQPGALKTAAAPAPILKPANLELSLEAFVLKADSPAEREKAVTCLSQAVYYEAAQESDDGQAAVAQVVLNRMRHPLYPKSVCGVVFQGASLPTGCQFSFTCDGSMAFRPEQVAWVRARAVAERALNGYVAKDVGAATHYHADYVDPYWASSVAKVTQIGTHIFYRWRGQLGMPESFRGQYAGGERAQGGFSLAVLTRARHKPAPIETQADGRVHTVIQASAPMTARDRFLALGAGGRLGSSFNAADYVAPRPAEAVQPAAAPAPAAPAVAVAETVATSPAG